MKVVSILLFANPNECKTCGVFNIQHFILVILTLFVIIIAIKNTNKDNIKSVIRISTIIIWVLEIIKIVFNIKIGNIENLNTYIPLYYCSILLYAGILSSIFNGVLERIGNVFIATGGIVAGIVFLIFPNTSLNSYNISHYITIQSFIYHGTMIYLGIVVNKYDYIKLNKNDILYYFMLILTIGIFAYIVNNIYGSNLMFLSKNFPNTPIDYIYQMFGKLFPIITLITQATLPFYLIYIINKIINKYSKIGEELIP